MVEKAKSRGNADAYRGSSTHYTAKILVLGELSLCERSVRASFLLLILFTDRAFLQATLDDEVDKVRILVAQCLDLILAVLDLQNRLSGERFGQRNVGELPPELCRARALTHGERPCPSAARLVTRKHLEFSVGGNVDDFGKVEQCLHRARRGAQFAICRAE